MNYLSTIKSVLKTESVLKYVISLIIIGCLTVFLELTLFNFRHYQFLSNVNTVSPVYTFSENLTFADYNAFEVLSVDTDPYVEVSDINMDVSNIYTDFVFPFEGDTYVRPLEIEFYLRDEGNTIGYPTKSRIFMHLIPQTHYHYIETYGKLRSFRIYFKNLNPGETVRILGLNLNSRVPFFLSAKRMLCLFIFFSVLFFLRPTSFLYSCRAIIPGKIRNLTLILLTALMVFSFYLITHINGYYRDPSIKNNSMEQYSLLAESLLNGHPYLEVEPPESLKEMEDPYDYEARYAATNDQAMYDTAYFDGHYYVYFGVAPVVLYYIPYYLITGTHISFSLLGFLNGILIFIAFLCLLMEICKKYFPKTTMAFFVIYSVLFISGSGLIYLLTTPGIYETAEATGLMFAVFGLYFWLHSVDEEKKGSLRRWSLILGSLCMALVVASRPPLIFTYVFGIFIFFEPVFKERSLFSKKGLLNTLCFMIPLMVVAALLMYYNYIRFKNPFDFGSDYNLTIHNLGLRRFQLGWLLYATVGWLFYPGRVTNIFPYFYPVDYSPAYIARNTVESIYGGLIYNNLYLLPVLFAFQFKKYISDKKQYLIVLLCPLYTILIMLFDVRFGGEYNRYFADFGIYYMIASLILYLSLYLHISKKKSSEAPGSELSILYGSFEKALDVFFYVCFIVCIIRLFLEVFGNTNGDPMNNFPLEYYKVMHLVEFWH